MHSTVVVQLLSAIARTKSPKPFSSVAVHSDFVICQGSGVSARTADDVPIHVKITNANSGERILTHLYRPLVISERRSWPIVSRDAHARQKVARALRRCRSSFCFRVSLEVFGIAPRSHRKSRIDRIRDWPGPRPRTSVCGNWSGTAATAGNLCSAKVGPGRSTPRGPQLPSNPTPNGDRLSSGSFI